MTVANQSPVKDVDVMSEPVNDVIRTISKIINHSKREIVMSSGRLDSRCYDSDKIISAISAALERHVTISVLIGPDVDPGSERIVKMLGSHIRHARTEPKFHFTVGDSKDVRFETEDIDDNAMTSNIQRLGTRPAGAYLRSRFIEEYRKATPIGV